MQVLQNLQVFGVRADYLQQFLDMLTREGVQTQALHVPVQQHGPIGTLGLQTLASGAGRFTECVPFKAAAVAPEALMLDLAYLTRCTATAPQGWFDDKVLGGTCQAAAARMALERGLLRAWRKAESDAYMSALAPVPLHEGNAGLPQHLLNGKPTFAWRLEIDVAGAVKNAILDAVREVVAQGLCEPALLDEVNALLLQCGGRLVDIGAQVHPSASAEPGRSQLRLEPALVVAEAARRCAMARHPPVPAAQPGRVRPAPVPRPRFRARFHVVDQAR